MSNLKLEKYLKIRNDSRNYVEKIISFSIDKNLIGKGARLLGMLGHNKNLILDSEDEINFLMDFIIFEKIRNNKNAIEHYLEHNQLDEYEQEIFNMFLNSYSSLFIVEESDVQNGTIKLKDYYTQEKTEIIDMGLSKSSIRGLPIFFRRMQYEDIAFTSGISYLIGSDLNSPEKLHKEIESTLKSIKEKDESVKKFIAFKRLNKKYGIDIEFRDAKL